MLTAASFFSAAIHTGGIRGSGDSCSLEQPVIGCSTVRSSWRETWKLFSVPQIWAGLCERLCIECNLRSVSQLNNFRAYEAGKDHWII